MSSFAFSGHCTSSEDGKPCACKKYQRPEKVIVGQPTLCEECAHGRSHHDGGENNPTTYSTGTVLGSLRRLDFDTRKLSEAKMETNHYRMKDSTVKETTKRGGSLGNKSGKGKKTAQADKTGGGEQGKGIAPTKERVIKIGKVVVMPDGYDSERDELVNTQVPKPPAILSLARKGLANNSPDLAFGSSWGPARMFVFLRGLLPKLFEHLALDHPWVVDIEEDDDEKLLKHDPLLLLLYADGRKLIISTRLHLTGTDCLESKGPPRVAIPPDVYEMWGSTVPMDDSGETGKDNGKGKAKRARSPSPPIDVESADVDDTTDEEIEAGPLSPKRPLKKRTRPLLFLDSEDEGEQSLAGPSGSGSTGTHTTDTATTTMATTTPEVVDLTQVDEGPAPGEEAQDTNDEGEGWWAMDYNNVTTSTTNNPWESAQRFDF
ncbi:hypothetical protein GSI_05301 [Ganoderma sinense ZZ0214-1]|uniref:Uncharacterized protein n=1 Tax=Ganoderma sinense ZZ0214-1 TaxID=1077348 RepID=A0A2G8SG87_9APHY|nr:hypothetical protein GSI_05301 [Ganoderma sinense ZZ0214-1]